MPLPRVIVILLLRLWALYTIATNVLYGIQFLVWQWSGEELGEAVSTRYYAFGSIYVALGLLVWFLARRLSYVIVPERFAASTSDMAPVAAEDLVGIGSFLIGIFQLSSKLPSLATHFVTLIDRLQTNATHQFPQGDVLPFVANVVADTGVIAIALFLTFRPRGIARLFAFLRGRT